MIKADIYDLPERTPIDRSTIGKIPRVEDKGRVFDGSTIFRLHGRPVMAYLILDEGDLHEIRHAVKTVHVQKSYRVSGLPTQSSVFGAMPRSGTRTDFCRFTVASREDTQNMSRMFRFADYLSSIYRHYFPDIYDKALNEVAETVHPDWRIGKTPFVTCNINMNHAIKYHYDAGNMRAALSNVLILKRGIDGGELVCPEFGITLSQRDRALTIFDGQSILHGVRPIAPRVGSVESYRASIVYYTLYGMKNCLCAKDEIARIKDVRTAKEHLSKNESRRRVIEVNRGPLSRAGIDPDQLLEKYKCKNDK